MLHTNIVKLGTSYLLSLLGHSFSWLLKGSKNIHKAENAGGSQDRLEAIKYIPGGKSKERSKLGASGSHL
jgi:hypothetical protein